MIFLLVRATHRCARVWRGYGAGGLCHTCAGVWHDHFVPYLGVWREALCAIPGLAGLHCSLLAGWHTCLHQAILGSLRERYGAGVPPSGGDPTQMVWRYGAGMARVWLTQWFQKAFQFKDLARVWHEGSLGYGANGLCQGMARGMARDLVPYYGANDDRALCAIPFEKIRCHICVK